MKWMTLIPVVSRPALDTSGRREKLRYLLMSEFNLKEQELRDHFEADLQKLRDEFGAKLLKAW